MHLNVFLLTLLKSMSNQMRIICEGMNVYSVNDILFFRTKILIMMN